MANETLLPKHENILPAKLNHNPITAASPTQPELKSAKLRQRCKVFTPDNMVEVSPAERLHFEVSNAKYGLIQKC